MKKINADALLEKVKEQGFENEAEVLELINSCEAVPEDPQIWNFEPLPAASIYISNVADANKAQEFIQYIDVYLRHNAS